MDKLTLQAKKAQIQKLIDTDDKAVARAVVRIYQRQTASEQRAEHTHLNNSIGFNAPDAKYLTFAAKYVLRNGALTGEHIDRVRAKIRRYWKQLAEIAEETNQRRVALGMDVVPLGGRNQQMSLM
jgi:negative regulator of sigma E activity